MSVFTVLALFRLALFFFSWASTTSSTCRGAQLASKVSEGGGGCVDAIVGAVSTPLLASTGVEVVQQEAASATNLSSTSKCKSQ